LPSSAKLELVKQSSLMLTLQSPGSQMGGRYLSRAPVYASQPHSNSHQSSVPHAMPTPQQLEQYKTKALELDRRYESFVCWYPHVCPFIGMSVRVSLCAKTNKLLIRN